MANRVRDQGGDQSFRTRDYDQAFEDGMHEIRRSVEASVSRQVYHKYMNTLMAHRALRWLCVDRGSQDFSFDALADNLFEDVDQSLRFRHEQSQQELSTSETTEKRRDTIRSDYGYLFEAMTIGVIAEDAAFRHARIIGLPASSRIERRTPETQVPPDIMLWQITNDHTVRAIGGIQAKTKSEAGTHDPHNFTATYVARKRVMGRLSAEVINTWLVHKNLKATHGHLYDAITRGKNIELIEALGLEPAYT